MKKLLIAGFILFGTQFARAATTTDFIFYGSTTALNCPGFNGLTASASVGISCTEQSNIGSTPAVDAYVTVISSNSSGAPAAPYAVQIYVYASADNVNYEMDLSSNPATGGGYTIATTAPSNLRLAKTVNLDTAGKQSIGSFSIANLYGGVMPQYWGLVIINNTGQTLGTAGNSAYFQYVNYKNQ